MTAVDGPDPAARPGRTGTLADVAGLRVGHCSRTGDGWLTGTTVVLPAPDGAVAGVDVRGGGPGTRETDLLDPRALVERVHAVVLTGGSAYGLAAAHGVMTRLADDGVGFRVGPEPGDVVPIVPAAVLFDLGRGGAFRSTPDEGFGAAAYDAAVTDGPREAARQGGVGAGTGATVGGLAGGVGSASVVLAGGTTVAALVVVNAAGSTVDPGTGELYGARFLPEEERVLLGPADPAEVAAARRLLAPGRLTSGARPSGPGGPPPGRPGAASAGSALNTTIGVVATDAPLTKARCQKVAGVAHDGLARAVRPVHGMFDGDALFALSTGDGPPLDPPAVDAVLAAAADVVTRAVVHAVLAAAGGPGRPAYREVFPSALRPS